MASTPQSNDSEIAQISALPTPVIEDVPFNLIAAHERKTTRLLKNAHDHQAIKSRNSYFPFSFEVPIFLYSIRITVQDFVEGSKFEYTWEGIDGRRHEGDAVSKSDEVYITIRGIAKSIAFKPPRAYFTSPHIKSVNIYGFEITQAGDFLQFSDEVDQLKELAIQKINSERVILDEERAKVNALQAQRGSLSQDIAALKSTVSREQGKLKRVETQRDEAAIKNSDIVRAISDESNRLESIKEEIVRTSSIRSQLAQKIIIKTTDLRDLQSNIHLFPSELSDFSRQGAKDFRSFFWLSLLPCLLIATMFTLLVMGSADLTTKITGAKYVNLPALAISRAPYVAVACAIITASYYIAKMLVLEMVRISRQRLALTKISILAKDISTSIDSNLDMSEDERYTRRLTLKMDMMKNHLQEYLSSDFTPTLPRDIIPSLAVIGAARWNKDKEAADKEAE